MAHDTDDHENRDKEEYFHFLIDKKNFSIVSSYNSWKITNNTELVLAVERSFIVPRDERDALKNIEDRFGGKIYRLFLLSLPISSGSKWFMRSMQCDDKN